MGILLDVLVVAVVAFSIWRGARRGFVEMLVRMIGYILVLAVVAALSGPLSKLIYNTFFEESIRQQVSAQVAANPELTSLAALADVVLQGLPAIISAAGLPTDAIPAFGSGGTGGDTAVSLITDNLVAPAVTAIIQSIVFLVLITLGMALVRRIARPVGAIRRVPVIGPLNTFLGGCIGAANAAIILIVATGVLWLIGPAGDSSSLLSAASIHASTLFEWIYEHNPLLTGAL